MPDTDQPIPGEAGAHPAQPDPTKPHYGYENRLEELLADPKDEGPSPTGEEIKAKQAAPEGSPEKEAERTRMDPDTGETLLPASADAAQKESLEAYERARAGGVPPEEGGVSRADVVEARMREVREGTNPAMLGVGRNIPEEQVELVRAADLPGDGIDLGRKFFAGTYGGPGSGAPVALPSHGQRHHMGAPWPPPLSGAARAPSASPEPGPEPDQQWHPPQDIVFADNDAAVRGTTGPGAEDQRKAQEAAVDRGSMPGRTTGRDASKTGTETARGPDDPEAHRIERGVRPGTGVPTGKSEKSTSEEKPKRQRKESEE